MTASEVLGRALLELAERHLTTPCQGRHRDRWTSDDVTQREWAAHSCRLCPVLASCRLAADDAQEKHHVWAGTDRTPPQPSRNRSRRPADA